MIFIAPNLERNQGALVTGRTDSWSETECL